MNRRFLLQGLGYLSLASVLSSCGSSSEQKIVVEILRRSFPTQLLNQAKKTLSPKTSVQVSTSVTVAELYGQIQRWQQSAIEASASTSQKQQPKGIRLAGLGDYWLTQAIESDLIEPLDLPQSSLDKLPSLWQDLVRRDEQGQPDPTAKIWGAPYRWGATVLVYRTDKFDKVSWGPKDWDDLWNPALKQRVGLLNQPREVIGMTLKTLGYSYNDPNPAQRPELQAKLKSLHQQTRLYSSRNYIEPLLIGDIWLAMGWSSDILPALAQDPKLAVIFPNSGSSVWADVWVKSKLSAKGNSDFPVDQLIHQWIDFWWEEAGASGIQKFSDAAPVIPVATDKEASILTQENLMKSEFLLPLGPDAIAQYRSLWLEMRSV